MHSLLLAKKLSILLLEKPLVVGGNKDDKRGIVACPNYLARKKGVRTAMPLSRALQLVPEANFIRSTRGLYSDYSKRSERSCWNSRR